MQSLWQHERHKGYALNINVVVRLKGKTYQHIADSEVIQFQINNIRFIEKDPDHIKTHFIFNENALLNTIYPIEGGIIVIDFDTDTIVNLQNEFAAGTMMHDNVHPDLLKELYDNGKILLDEIDYMIDIRPFVHENYDAEFQSESELAKRKLEQLDFKMGVYNIYCWDFWTQSVLTNT